MSLYSKDFNYQVKQHLTTFAEHKGYTLEINVIDYGRGEDKYDIRRWDRRDSTSPKLLKGITMTEAEYNALANYFKGAN